ncbi:hypothetical protein F4778DRAFT_439169 [Xylariomycetidae sp. FL2044]|nr:hypothetical protein F4778DRAFT_439169 [Xylariomycetidae sp. FL2044]
MDGVDYMSDLTFAVEIKFLVPVLRTGTEDPFGLDNPPVCRVDASSDPSDTSETVYAHIANTIGEIPTTQAATGACLTENPEACRDCWERLWVVKKSNSAEPAEDDPRYDYYTWIPVEINSPKLLWADRNSLRKLKEVLAILKSRYRIVSNYTCEVHVHVGRRDDSAFSLPTLKRLATLCWFAEPTLRSVRNPASPNYNHTYTWSSPLRMFSRLAERADDKALCPDDELGQFGGLDSCIQDLLRKRRTRHPRDYAAMRGLWDACTHEDLAKLLSGPTREYQRLGFNFSAFGESSRRSEASPTTFECRFLEAMVQTDAVLGWVNLISTLVQTSMNSEKANLRYETALKHMIQQGDSLAPDQAFQLLSEDLNLSREQYGPILTLIRKHLGFAYMEDSFWSQE